jgi:hypothetical protein
LLWVLFNYLQDFIALPYKSVLSLHYHGGKRGLLGHGFLRKTLISITACEGVYRFIVSSVFFAPLKSDYLAATLIYPIAAPSASFQWQLR